MSGGGGGDLDVLLDRLRDAAAKQAPELLAQVDELQTHLEIARTAAVREASSAQGLLSEAQRSRRRYEELFDESPGAYVVTDGNTKILAANHRANALLGAQKLDGRLLVALLAPEDRPAFRRALLRIVQESGTVHLGIVVRRGTTHERALFGTARRVGGGETPITLHWLLVDRTELREAELRLPSDDELFGRLAQTNLDRLSQAHRDLEAERGRLQRVLARFPGGLIAVDRELHVLFSNAPARRILFPHLLSRGDALPDPWDAFSLREYAAGLFEPRRVLAERQVDLDDGRVIAVNGIPHRAGGDTFLLLADVTVEARRTRIEREFVRNAAHELRTPLTAISTAIEVLQGGAKENPEDRDRFLAHIERQCVRLNRLTQSMLVLARAQADQQAPRLEFVALRPLLDEIAASLRPAESVTVSVECEPNLALFVDRDLAEHAVLNLALNATRHTRRGTVSLAARAVGERRVEIVVADDGEGILPEHRERLLEPFYRGGGRDGEGFGLGLAISNQAIRTLGGTLELESEPGVGTRAVVQLPSARLVARE